MSIAIVFSIYINHDFRNHNDVMMDSEEGDFKVGGAGDAVTTRIPVHIEVEGFAQWWSNSMCNTHG